MKNTPPTGVAIPTIFIGEISAAFNAVSVYNDPQKKTIPIMKQFPAQMAHRLDTRSDTSPTNSSAKT